MGFFGSVRDLHRQARQVQRDAPAAADRLASARERMASLNEMMAAQARVANRVVVDPADPSVVRRTVTIAGMRQIAMVNFDLLFEFELTVLPDGVPPYPATTQQLVSQADVRRLVPGLTLEATVDLSNSAAIWLDLGSLR